MLAEYDEVMQPLDELVPHPPAVPPPDVLLQSVIALAQAVSKPPGVPRKKMDRAYFLRIDL